MKGTVGSSALPGALVWRKQFPLSKLLLTFCPSRADCDCGFAAEDGLLAPLLLLRRRAGWNVPSGSHT